MALIASASAPVGAPPPFRGHAVPEEGVVPHLGGVVVDAAAGGLDDLFQALAFERGAGHQVVQVGDVGLMVLAVVVSKVSADRCGARASWHTAGRAVRKPCESFVVEVRRVRACSSGPAMLRGTQAHRSLGGSLYGKPCVSRDGADLRSPAAPAGRQPAGPRSRRPAPVVDAEQRPALPPRAASIAARQHLLRVERGQPGANSSRRARSRSGAGGARPSAAAPGARAVRARPSAAWRANRHGAGPSSASQRCSRRSASARRDRRSAAQSRRCASPSSRACTAAAAGARAAAACAGGPRAAARPARQRRWAWARAGRRRSRPASCRSRDRRRRSPAPRWRRPRAPPARR